MDIGSRNRVPGSSGVWLVCLVLLTITWARPASAQSPDESGAGMISVSDGVFDVSGEGSGFSGSVPLGKEGAYLLLNKNIGQGVGYDDGYSTLGFFSPIINFKNQSVLFGSIRFFVTDDLEHPGVNVGLGLRIYDDETNRILGGSIWYDSDESSNGHRWDQLTFGLELIGDKFEIRANGYMPLSEGDELVRVDKTGVDPFFRENQILFYRHRLFRSSHGRGRC